MGHWIKRFFFFGLVNILVVISVSVILQLLGVNQYQYGGNQLDINNLAIFCLVWGMVGSFISLALSRIMAKKMMGVRVIDPNTRDGELGELVSTVHRLARSAGLSTMPEVGVYDSPEVNAFATGPTRNRSLVAVSTGLLQRMNREETEGVLGHEIAHIANGDMVTMALIQGVVNAFVMFLARIISFAIAQALRDRDSDSRSSPFLQFAIQMVLEIVFMIAGSMVVAWFSRHREFRADAGGARFAGRDQMISALEKLKQTYEIQDDSHRPASLKTMQISGRAGFLALFSSHPPLSVRIERLTRRSS